MVSLPFRCQILRHHPVVGRALRLPLSRSRSGAMGVWGRIRITDHRGRTQLELGRSCRVEFRTETPFAAFLWCIEPCGCRTNSVGFVCVNADYLRRSKQSCVIFGVHQILFWPAAAHPICLRTYLGGQRGVTHCCCRCIIRSILPFTAGHTYSSRRMVLFTWR